MKTKQSSTGMGRYDSCSSRREQALCADAIEGHAFDGMTDNEWVALCERISHEEAQEGESTGVVNARDTRLESPPQPARTQRR